MDELIVFVFGWVVICAVMWAANDSVVTLVGCLTIAVLIGLAIVHIMHGDWR